MQARLAMSGFIMNWYLAVLKKYTTFSGRARRKEYWMFTLFNIIAACIAMVIDGVLGGTGIVTIIYALATLLPSLAVTVRRLHDTGRSAWLLLLGLVPFVSIVLIIFMCLEGQLQSNQYGDNPKLVDPE